MSNAERHRRNVELFNARDWAGFAAGLSSDCEFVDHALGVTAKGPQQCIELEQAWVAAFSDAVITSPRVIDAGATTVLLFIGEGTNDGPLGRFPATGRRGSLPFCEVREHDAEGKMVRGEVYYDQASLLAQLGHLPAPEG